MTKTTILKSEKTYVKTNKLSVQKVKEPPKRTNVIKPLSTEKRKEIRDLINDFVTTSNLARKPIMHGKAYGKLYEIALKGDVNGIEQIEDSEFETCTSWLKQQIMILENSDTAGATKKKSDWRRKRITNIQTRCKKAGVTDERRRAYLSARFGHESLSLLDDDELEECYGYAQKNPSWTPPKYETPGTQQQREKALGLLLDELEQNANAAGSVFDRHNITLGKGVVLSMLAQRDRTLFCDNDGNPIAETTFSRFLTKAKMCKFKAGRKIG
jgi:hypothetical protein